MNKFTLAIMSYLLFTWALPTFAQQEKELSSHPKEGVAPKLGDKPDYSNLFYWAASPHKKDMSDSIPDFLKDETRSDSADVFFIHPTTYVGSEDSENAHDEEPNRREIFAAIRHLSWNADLTDAYINERTDNRVLLNQATVFNGSCRIYTPRYRQASIKAFFVPNTESARKAFDIAYQDIKTAFEYYMQYENKGRPVIIASHSQGTVHAIRLLQEYFDGKPLHSQLVCAYLIGWPVPEHAFQSIHLSTTPDDTGGFVEWRSYRKGVVNDRIKKSLCVNPLTWTTTTDEIFKKPGDGVFVNGKMINPNNISVSINAPVGVLWVSVPNMKDERMNRLKNLHTFDYNLFWMEMRRNVKQRITSWYRSEKIPDSRK